jgi:predicted lipoprotein with Yx(FWY)xxD motif
MTRRKAWAIPVLIAVALTATACSKATGTGTQTGGAYGTPASSMPATSGGIQTAALKVEHTRAGMVLADGKGLTLYYFTEDKRDSGKSVCTGSCASAWPPLTTAVKAPAGVHLPGPLGMITRAGGVKQVTINGFPIYYFARDKAPGQITGNGAEGTWHVIKLSTAAATGSATTGRALVLKAEHTKAGTVLAGRKGLTLYYFTEDKPGSGKSMCTDSCASAWPPLAAPAKAAAGVRMPGPIGMITRPDGTKQVTINGYPVYYYAGDKAPGQVTGNGAGGTWHVIKVKKTSASTSTGTTGTPSTKPMATPTAPAGGGGYGY